METKKRYRDLDEVRAPEDLPEVGVKAGDRGVVIAELRNPTASLSERSAEAPPTAVEVEYPDDDGVPKAFAVYTPDLSRLLSVRRKF
jgi:hypothetical protein